MSRTTPKPVTEGALRKRLHVHRAAMAAKGLYPVTVKAALVTREGITVIHVPGDAAHPTIDPKLTNEALAEVTARVRFRRETLWHGATVKRGEFVTVPLSQVTWLD